MSLAGPTPRPWSKAAPQVVFGKQHQNPEALDPRLRAQARTELAAESFRPWH